jgi:hypothetical protein
MVAGIDQGGVGIEEAGKPIQVTRLGGPQQLLVRVHDISSGSKWTPQQMPCEYMRAGIATP